MSQTLSGKKRVTSAIRSETRLRGRALVLARGVCLLLTALMLVCLLPSFQAYYQVLHRVCDNPASCLLFTQATPNKLLALHRLGLELSGFVIYSLCVQTIVTLAFLTMGALIFWRRSDTWLGVLASLILTFLGCSGIFFSLVGSFQATNQPFILVLASQVFLPGDVPLGLFLLIFPTGRFIPRWSLAVVLLFFINGISFTLPAPYSFFFWPLFLQAMIILLELSGVIVIQIYRFLWVYTPIERQQAKWLFASFTGGVLCFASFFFGLPLLPGLNTPDSPAHLLDLLGGALLYLSLPLGTGIAILRYRLWDIDAIINKALVYGALTLLLAALYGGLIIGLESLSNLIIGRAFASPAVLVISTLAIAALFQPARRRIQALIDRRFYRQKYDSARTLEAFSATLKNEGNLRELCEQVLAVVQETMQPAHLTLWLCPPRQIREESVDLPHD
ncbi:MAG TPA: hypothetical protein VGD98_03405 [Ktedonobacteraceae bacterium]